MRTDVAIIKANHATKEDIASVCVEVHQTIANKTKYLAATMLGITGVAIAKLLF